MKKRAFGLIFCFAVAILSLVVCLPKNTSFAATVDNTKLAYYLLDDGKPYESTIEAGRSSGYDEYLLGETNIKPIEATANNGFALVGWRVVFTDNVSKQYSATRKINGTEILNNQEIFKSTDFEVVYDAENFSESFSVKYKITYHDADMDGFYDSGKLEFDKVVENATIDPVFDYIYSNIDATNLVELDNVLNLEVWHKIENVLPNTNLIYKTSTIETGKTKYSNSYLQKEGKYFYFGDVYCDDGSTDYYTLNTKSDGTSTYQKVLISRGRYRLNETIEINADVAVNSTDLAAGKNVDVLGIGLTTDEKSTTLQENKSYSLVKDEFNRTTKINVTAKMPLSTTKVAVLFVDYDNLFVATIVPKINDAPAGENENFVFNALTINQNSYFSVIENNKKYFVKDAVSGHNVSGFKLTANQKISNQGYDYYTFGNLFSTYEPVAKSIDQNNLFVTNQIDQNFEIEVNYVAVLYNVNFKFALYDESSRKFRKIDGEFNVEQMLQLERGTTSNTISKTEQSNNVGYTFVGFVAEENTQGLELKTGVNPQTTTTISIDKNKPANKTILMLFVETNYTIRFNNINKIKLNDGTKDIYPVASVLMNVLRSGNSLSSNLANINVSNATSSFEKNVKIGDSISIVASLNNGFKLNGFGFNDTDVSFNGNTINLVLTQEILSSYDQAGTSFIDIFDFEDFLTYTVTYTINGEYNSNGNKVIMADLSVEYGGTIYSKANQSDTIKYYELGQEKAQIVVSNLHMYDTIKLFAKARSVNNDEAEPYFLFNRFTENFQTNFTLIESGEANTKATSYFVKKDIEIFAVYSMPGLWLNVSVDKSSAFNLLQTIEQGLTYVTDEENTQINFTTEELLHGKNYVLHLADALSFGYELTGYNYNGVTYNIDSLTNPLQFEFRTLNTTTIHTIEILTNVIVYKLNLTYATSLEDAPTAIDSFNITVDNLHIGFNLLEGYYTSQAYFINAMGKNRYVKAEKDNDYSSNVYSYDFTTEELSDVIDAYSVVADGVQTLNLHFIYALHKYTICVNYSLVSSKAQFDSKVSFPSITMTANGEKVFYTDTSDSRIFENIPYGANVVLTADDNYQEGMSPYGWVYEPQAGFSSTYTQLTINKLVSNQNVTYKLNYNSYSVLIVANGNTRNPIVTIRDAATDNIVDKISRFDKLTIDSNADKQNGWRFVNMYYYKNVYNPYVYDEATFASTELYILTNTGYVLNHDAYDANVEYFVKTKTRQNFSAFEQYVYYEDSWAENWADLFYLSAGEYKRNDSSTYDENKIYFSYKNTIYEDNDFQIGNYFADVSENGVYSICFTLEYSYIDIAIKFTATTQGSANLNKGDLTIAPIDYADISLATIDNGGNVTNIALNSTVTIENSILRIKLNLKTITKDGSNFSLSNGVELINAFVYDKAIGNLTINQVNGEYWLEFYISSMLNNNCLSDNDSFDIYLTYQVKTKRMILTTNVPENNNISGFYKDKTTGSTIFSMSDNQNRYGFGNGSKSSSGADRLTDNFQFLGKVYVSYTFIGNYRDYNNYFKIVGIKLYTIKSVRNSFGVLTYVKGDLISTQTEEDYAKYGVTGISFDDKCFDYRFVNDLYIELQVQPVVIINAENNRFNFTYKCDQQGNGQENELTIGQNSNYHIQIADILKDYVAVSFHKNIIQNGITIGFGEEESKLIDAGTYLVKIKFIGSGNWNWLSSLTYDKDLFVIISPKELELKVDTDTFSRKTPYEKEYVGKNVYTFSNIDDLLKYVYLTDGAKTYVYSNDNDNLRLFMADIRAYTTYTNGDAQIKSGIATRDGELFNIQLSGLKLNSTNFKLKNEDLLFENAIKINQREIVLSGVKVYDKVFDGTDKAEFRLDSPLAWGNVVDGDIVDAPNYADLVLSFAKDEFGNVPIGYNINIVVDASKALKGVDAGNYKIKVNGTTANVYPYSISTIVEGFGKIEVRNDKGLINIDTGTRHELAGLIPINAKLRVDVIYADSPEFASLYSKMSSYLNRNRTFVVGYRICFDNNNLTTKLDNNLTLVLPNVDRLTNLLMLTSSNSVELQYTLENNSLVIDLSQTNFEANTFGIIQQRVLFKQWQLILIISLILLLLLIAIIIFIIVRKRKKDKYSVNERI